MKKIRILYNTAGMLPISNKTGGATEKLIGEQIKRIGKNYLVFVVGEVTEDREEVVVIPYGMYSENVLSLLLNNLKVFFKIKNIDTNVIISNHHRNFLSSLLYSKIKRKTLIMWEYDHTYWIGPYNLLKRIYHWLLKYSDVIITVSETQKERMISCGIPEKKK